MRSLLFTLSVLLGPSIAFSAETERPNILYFFVDDMGWGSIGPNGQAERKAKGLPYVRTPNLNRLAAAGVNFSRGYGCPVCSPSRASQQTGFHQGHTFADRNDPDNAKKAMRADDVTMGDALSAAGYVTGYWGKWGFGGSKSLPDPIIENVQTLPTSHGYKYVLAELHHVRAHTFFQPTLWSAPAPAGSVGGLELIPNSMARYKDNAHYPAEPALQNHADYPATGYCDDAYAFAALDFVRSQGQNFNKSGQPFFGLLAVQIPHAPFAEVARLPDWDKAYADDLHFKSLAEQSQQWTAMVTRIDAHFGNILAALEDPNNDGDTSDSVAENTLVIFQSDNGGPAGKNNVQLDANGGLRGNKGSVYEGGIRVPLVMRWPAKITSNSALKAGTTTDRVVDITDLLPTFCDLAGTPTPVGIDGVSIAPTLLSSGHQRTRDFIIHEAGGSSSIIRGRHKLIRSVPKRSTKVTWELYDLNNDHAEQNNIAGKHSELVNGLKIQLLGERVTEPKGFANTYHHWTAQNGGGLSVADNWSDYAYSNADITYMTDAGTPQASWTARMENSGTEPNNVKSFVSRKFLGLEIKGNSKTKAIQSLVLAPKVHLTGLNEIRLRPHSSLTINGGTVVTRRWVDVLPNATLQGTGSIDGTVYNGGSLIVTGGEQSTLKITGDYYQSDAATLTLKLVTAEYSVFSVQGTTQLTGRLAITVPNGFEPKANETFTVLSAGKITGTFTNPDDTVTAADGSRFSIGYSDSAVILTLK
ncbi:MAG: arylsulfatase A-like enzyme [Porticoccaceae bacterium]|jgi:arylsulfatase A-like enzyme